MATNKCQGVHVGVRSFSLIVRAFLPPTLSSGLSRLRRWAVADARVIMSLSVHNHRLLRRGPRGPFDCVTQSARTKTPLLASARRPDRQTRSATDPGIVHGGIQGWREGGMEGWIDR